MNTRLLYEPLLTRTLESAVDYLSGLETSPAGATATLEQLRHRLNEPLPETSMDPVQVIAQLVSDVQGGLVGNAGGRFFGWVIGGAVPASLAADWLASAWDQNAGMFAVAPAAAVVEEVCGRWILELLRLPSTASFALVTGCQMAHVTCLAAARNAVLAKHGWDVEQQGLFGAPAIRVVTSERRHGTIERALRLLGMGRDAITDIPCGAEGLTGQALARALAAAPKVPTIVLLQAGDLNTGAFDAFDELVPVARKYGAWVHVDGAFGLWVATSPRYQHLTAGVQHADSWATDGHKWLNVPYDCGFAIVADRAAHFRAFSHRVSYLSHSDVARDQVDWNPEYSRRARGFATYAAIRSLGREGIGKIVEACCENARAIVAKAGRLRGVQVLHLPEINQGLLRFLDLRQGATEADHDRRTDEITARIVASGSALFACTTWQGMRCMRVSVCGWSTTSDDVDRAVLAIERSLALDAADASASEGGAPQ
jgi:glutamate/tyrosine decarboxylase-like PLP-dependent enzyme